MPTLPIPQRRVLSALPLTAQAFAPYGDLIEAGSSATHYPINDGHAERYHDLARIDTGEGGGRTLLNIFRARARPLPLALSVMERHCLGSQAFMPMAQQRFLVVVAPAGPAPGPDDLRCFVANPGQGVNYARGTWHHPLLAIDADCDFLVIDRGGPGAKDDCDEHPIAAFGLWVEA